MSSRENSLTIIQIVQWITFRVLLVMPIPHQLRDGGIQVVQDPLHLGQRQNEAVPDMNGIERGLGLER